MTLKTGPAASVARVGDDFAFPSALLAGGIADCLSEETVYDPLDLSCTLAGRACLDVGGVLCAFAAAFAAWDEFLYADFLLCPVRNFVKSHLDPDADVPSSVNLLSRTPMVV